MSRHLILILLLCSASASAQNPEIDLLRDINLDRNRELDAFFGLISNTTAWIAYLTPVLFFIYSLLGKNLNVRNNSLIIGATVFNSALLANVIKYAVDRPRPFITYPDLEKLSSGGSPSFPSGHTTDAFALATILSLLFPKWYVILPAYVWAVLVAYSRMHLGVHYPGDVAAGIIVGVFSALMVFYGWRKIRKKNR